MRLGHTDSEGGILGIFGSGGTNIIELTPEETELLNASLGNGTSVGIIPGNQAGGGVGILGVGGSGGAGILGNGTVNAVTISLSNEEFELLLETIGR